jgi:ubiquinone/menaquinone biosynthesis C-methylase UbiE
MNRLAIFAALACIASCGGAGASSPPRGHPAPLGHRFRSAEEWAKVFDDPARDAWQKPEEVVALTKIDPAMVVVDVGAGTGYFELRLSRAVGPSGRVLALDVEPDMIRYLKERGAREGWTNVEARLAATDDPDLSDASVDRVLVVDTWHHVPERVAYAKKLRAALRAKGRVVVVDFTKESTMGPPPEHRLSPQSVRDELAAAGLETEIVDEDLPEQYVVVGSVP